MKYRITLTELMVRLNPPVVFEVEADTEDDAFVVADDEADRVLTGVVIADSNYVSTAFNIDSTGYDLEELPD